MNAATVTQGLICHVFNKLYHQRSTRVRLNCCWIRRKQTKLESHRGKKKKNKKNNRGSIDSFTEICLLHQSCSDPGEVSEGITGSHAWRSSPARHVSKPDTDCNIHFIPEYKRTISPWNLQTYCASPEQAAVRHDGEWNTKNTNKSRIRGDSEEKKSYLLMR